MLRKLLKKILFFIKKKNRLCPPGSYKDKASQICNDCASTCKTCYGKGEDLCGTCYENVLFDDGRCVEKCPLNTF